MDNKKKLDQDCKKLEQEVIREQMLIFMKEQRLTNLAVADILDVSNVYLGHYLNGKKNVSKKLLGYMNNLMKTYKVTYSLRDENF